jgi:hypothetical protein
MLATKIAKKAKLAEPDFSQRKRRARAMADNPKGIVSFSPGLRGTSYPGCERKNDHNPEWVASGDHAPTTQPFQGWKLFCGFTQGSPESVRGNRWAQGCNPVGIVDIST